MELPAGDDQGLRESIGVSRPPRGRRVCCGSPPREADCHKGSRLVAEIGAANSPTRLALAMQNAGATMSEYQRGLLAGFLAVQLLLAGCSHGHLETVGDDQAQEWVKPQPAASPVALYAIPPIEPKGKVCVRSLGPERVVGPRGQLGSFLHISVAVENAEDPVTWTLDPRDMKLNFVGSPWPVPAYSKTVPAGTKLAIPQGKRGDLDLIFPRGREVDQSTSSFLWQIHRGSETDTVSTRFEAASPSPTIGEDSGNSAACGSLSREAGRHATHRLSVESHPI